MNRRRQAYILVLPSLFTTGNLFCGFYAILHAFHSHFEQAAYAIFFAGIFDVLDGRVARLTKATSQFGVEYDSIADVVSFGIAPAVLAYVWVLQDFGRIGWAGAFFFAACGALRLARFNTLASGDQPKSYFLGLPIPAAANTVAATAVAYGDLHFDNAGPIVLGMLFALGALMVSNIRYRSFKDLDFRRRQGFFLLVLFVGLLAAVAVRPELTLWALFLGYALWGPVGELWRVLFRRRSVTAEGGREASTPTAEPR
jgi:CDP-diacylglycerol--serine O-phosphatidyltransferase